MRVLDETKKENIGRAAIKLIVTEGFAATSMHRIADEARVAASTIYLYFRNKEDMLNNLYLMVKRDFSEKLFEHFDAVMPVEQGIRRIYENIVRYFEDNPLNSSFMEQFENSALIQDEQREEARSLYQQVFTLIERGIDEGILKSVSSMSIASFIFYPIVSKIRRAHYEQTKLNDQTKEEIFQMTWDAIKA